MYQRLMEAEKKIKRGWDFPPDVVLLLKEITERVGGKEHWHVVTAAIAALGSMPQDQQNAWINRVRMTDGPGGSFAEFVEEIRSESKKTSKKSDKTKG